MANKKEQQWLDWITLQGCMVHDHNCGGGLHRHHLTRGRKKNHFRTIPLCAYHHHWSSPLPIGDAYHKGTKPWERKHGSQEQMLIELRIQFEREHGYKIWE